jgi:hypothetical protein
VIDPVTEESSQCRRIRSSTRRTGRRRDCSDPESGSRVRAGGRRADGLRPVRSRRIRLGSAVPRARRARVRPGWVPNTRRGGRVGERRTQGPRRLMSESRRWSRHVLSALNDQDAGISPALDARVVCAPCSAARRQPSDPVMCTSSGQAETLAVATKWMTSSVGRTRPNA